MTYALVRVECRSLAMRRPPHFLDANLNITEKLKTKAARPSRVDQARVGVSNEIRPIASGVRATKF